MTRKKEITVVRSFGTASKAEVFEELIWIVCKKRVKLKPAPVGGGHDDRAGGHESGRAC
jgi:hypothetical protein